MDLIDFHSKEFQQWLQDFLQAIIREKVRGVSIACYLSDGTIMESCYNFERWISKDPMQAIAKDTVNHPAHYTQGGIECIDAIRAATGEGFPDYCRGNVIKYIWRYAQKNGIEDLKKAAVYLQWMIDYLEGKTND